MTTCRRVQSFWCPIMRLAKIDEARQLEAMHWPRESVQSPDGPPHLPLLHCGRGLGRSRRVFRRNRRMKAPRNTRRVPHLRLRDATAFASIALGVWVSHVAAEVAPPTLVIRD